MEYRFSRAWAEINLDNMAHNVKEIRKITNKRTELMGVVKADAYGHGAVEVARALLENGVSRLAVAMIDEAIQLRKHGIDAPILIMSHTDPSRAEDVIKYNVAQTVFSYELAEVLSNAAIRLGHKARIHIKVDTGMTRVGFKPGYGIVEGIIEMSKLKGIIVEGMFTHFASADENDRDYTYMQFEKYISICTELRRVGIHIPIKHVANSAALIEFPEMHLDMVRPGIILYGHYPSSKIDRSKINLKPAMTLKANIILVKEVEYNIPVSYGRVFTTRRRSKIATVPVGYADGYSRTLTGKARVLINGEYAPVVGAICMDQFMVDVTDVKSDVKVGDEVVIFGTQAGKEIKAEEVASLAGTINYEVISVVGKRIPRVYLKGGKIYSVLNYLV
ncbi:MAG: alanine racemase [Clostridiaceae bacterium]|nr:alanine racemase [Clostridiaceae bacterium]